MSNSSRDWRYHTYLPRDRRLTVHRGPPAWVGNDLSAPSWHSFYLQDQHSLGFSIMRFCSWALWVKIGVESLTKVVLLSQLVRYRIDNVTFKGTTFLVYCFRPDSWDLLLHSWAIFAEHFRIVHTEWKLTSYSNYFFYFYMPFRWVNGKLKYMIPQ